MDSRTSLRRRMGGEIMASNNEPKSGMLGSTFRRVMASKHPTWPREGVQKAIEGETMKQGLANGFPLGRRAGQND